MVYATTKQINITMTIMIAGTTAISATISNGFIEEENLLGGGGSRAETFLCKV